MQARAIFISRRTLITSSVFWVYAGKEAAHCFVANSGREQSPRRRDTLTSCFKTSTKSGKTTRRRFNKMVWAYTFLRCLELCFRDAPGGRRFPQSSENSVPSGLALGRKFG